MNWIEGQPILFSNDTTEDCCVDCFEQVAFQQDTIMWQFNVPPCFTEKPATTDCFFTGPSAWNPTNVSDTTGSALFVGIGANIFQNVLNATSWYKVELEVFSVNDLVALQLTGFGDPIIITEEGNYEFLVQASSPQIKLETISNGGSPTGTVATVPSLCATEVTEPTVKAFNEDGVELTSPNISQVRSGEFVTWMFNIEDNTTPLNGAVRFYFEVALDCDGTIDTWTSEMIKIIPIDSCHLQYGWCGNVEQFNFDYFVPTLRLETRMRPVTYDYDSELYRNTEGRTTILYSGRIKVWEIETIEAPEHIIDFLSLIPIMQQVSVRKRYESSRDFVTFENELSVNYIEGSDNLARVTISLQEQLNNATNYFNGDYCNVGLPPRVLGTEIPQQAVLTEDNKLIEVE